MGLGGGEGCRGPPSPAPPHRRRPPPAPPPLPLGPLVSPSTPRQQQNNRQLTSSPGPAVQARGGVSRTVKMATLMIWQG